MVDTPPCVSKDHDWEALCISLDRCSDETSGVISVPGEIVLQKIKIGFYRKCTSDNKRHRYMPYKTNHIQMIRLRQICRMYCTMIYQSQNSYSHFV